MAAEVRPAVRVLLVDEDKKILLFKAVNPDNGLAFWFPPGGGIEPGETAERAVARELLEETGLTDVRVEAEVWNRRHVFTWRGNEWDQRERWFMAYVDSFDPDTSGMALNEMADVDEIRWWSCDDINASDERFVPLNLGDLLEALFRDGPPTLPTIVGE